MTAGPAQPMPIGERPADEGTEIAVSVRCAGWRNDLPDAATLSRRATRAVLAAVGVGDPVEVSLVLADDAFMAKLNRDYRGQDRPTNVLSFRNFDAAPRGPRAALPRGYAAAPTLLGDVVVAYETAAREASAADRRLADHLCHLVVHGVLHLLGYDHENDLDAEAMERLELSILAGLGIADPYAGEPGVALDNERS